MTTLAAALLLFAAGVALALAALLDNARAAGWGYTAALAAVGCLVIGELF